MSCRHASVVCSTFVPWVANKALKYSITVEFSDAASFNQSATRKPAMDTLLVSKASSILSLERPVNKVFITVTTNRW